PSPFALAVPRRSFPKGTLPMTHGLTIIEKTEGARAIVPASLAVIGLVATATATGSENIAALDAAFPLNTPVLIAGSVAAAAGRAGTGGTLKPALTAIADQASAIVVVVRVAEGTGETAIEKAESLEAN